MHTSVAHVARYEGVDVVRREFGVGAADRVRGRFDVRVRDLVEGASQHVADRRRRFIILKAPSQRGRHPLLVRGPSINILALLRRVVRRGRLFLLYRFGIIARVVADQVGAVSYTHLTLPTKA